MKRTALMAAAALAVALTGTARAQQAGEYDGQTADGNPVAIVVGNDSGTGNFEVTVAEFDFVIACKKSGDQLGSGWYIGFPDGYDILDGDFSYAIAYSDAYLPFSMHFKGKKSVKGEVALTEPMFNPVSGYNTPPKKTQTCSSDQPFTATFSGAVPKLRVAPGTVTIKTRNTTMLVPLKHR
jgi:hypothetical protein